MPNMDIPEDADFRPIKYFAVLVGNEYAGPIGFPDSEHMQAILAALESDPTIMPITPEQLSGVLPGWVWNGQAFIAPEGV